MQFVVFIINLSSNVSCFRLISYLAINTKLFIRIYGTAMSLQREEKSLLSIVFGMGQNVTKLINHIH